MTMPGVIQSDDDYGTVLEARSIVPMDWDVRFITGLLEPGNPILGVLGNHVGLVVDSRVWWFSRYRDQITTYFAERGIRTDVHVVPGGEAAKTDKHFLALARAMSQWGLPRSGPLIAIGGGAVIDLTGFTASTHRRGTRWYAVPTTLLGMVDAAIGPKVGINLRAWKNRLGGYFPPAVTFIDREFLRTVDAAQIASGMAEIVKAAVAANVELFELVERHGRAVASAGFHPDGPDLVAASDRIIRWATETMVRQLQRNPIETVKRRAMDFGHAIGPTIEIPAGILHGESVALDMAVFTAVSAARGLLDVADRDRVLVLLHELGLPLTHDLITAETVERALADLPLVRGGKQNLPLLTGIGRVGFFDDITAAEVNDAVRFVGGFAASLDSTD